MKSMEHSLERYWDVYVMSRTVAFWMSSEHREKRLLASSSLSVRMEQLGYHWTDFHEISYLRIVQKCVEKVLVLRYNLTIVMATLHEDRCTSVIISLWILRMKHVLYKILEKIKKTHFIFNCFVENHAVCDIIWGKNTKCIVALSLK